MSNDNKCILCQASYVPQAMVGNKCRTCNALYPNAESIDDIKVENKDRAETLSIQVVEKMIYRILEDAGIVRKKCENCGSLFFSKSPATKFCKACPKGSRSVADEVKADGATPTNMVKENN